MTPAVVSFLSRVRLESERQSMIKEQQKQMNITEGRNILVYRGVPYVRYNAR
tara:strand:- start:978 stop:1133 length:156 start_codon:yes stop_codon:yes gene_type:complete